MSEIFGKLFERRAPQNGASARPALPAGGSSPRATVSQPSPSFSKVFRWTLPEGVTELPKTVEVAGSFNQWTKVPLERDAATGGWHVTLKDIPAHRTHHYMLLVDGAPTYDKTCDGYAIPQGAAEEAFALQTPRGPRLLMLFSQTK